MKHINFWSMPKEYEKPYYLRKLLESKTTSERRDPSRRTKMIEQKKFGEKLVDKWLKRCVEEAGGMIIKMHPITNAGMPDRLVHFRNMTFYVEVKTSNEECSPLQVEMHKRIKSFHIDTYVLDVKIENIWDLFSLAYTTYEGKHYMKNPFVKH